MIRRLLFSCLLAVLWACGEGALDLNLELDAAGGLRPGAPVMAGGNAVGEVLSVDPNPRGGFVAKLRIRPEFRDQATAATRFVVASEPDNSDRSRVELRPGQADSPPLADGMTVRGSIESPSLFPLGKWLRGFSEGLGALSDQVERFRSEIMRLPQSEEARQLREQWEHLQQELQRAQAAAEDSVKNDLIPRLQQELDEIQKKFRELEARPKPKSESI